jgi:putative acetyltransferase
MSQIDVRHFEPRDLPQIHALYSEREAFANTLQLPFQSEEQWRSKIGAAKEGFTNLVAVRGDEVVGQLTLETFQRARRRHVATFGMGVKASARRLGVGSALISAAIEVCEKWSNVSRIEIEVYTDNAAAIALYSRHGFVIEGTCRRYAFRDGQFVDAHVMARLSES